MKIHDKNMTIANFVMKEYVIPLQYEHLKMFYDEFILRSIKEKSNCHIELTERIIKKKINKFKATYHAVIRLEGQNFRDIKKCNQLLENQFYLYKERKDYEKERRKLNKITQCNSKENNETQNKDSIRKFNEIKPYDLNFLHFENLNQWRISDFEFNKQCDADLHYYLWHSFSKQESNDFKNLNVLPLKCDSLDQISKQKQKIKVKNFLKHNKYLTSYSKSNENKTKRKTKKSLPITSMKTKSFGLKENMNKIFSYENNINIEPQTEIGDIDRNFKEHKILTDASNFDIDYENNKENATNMDMQKITTDDDKMIFTQNEVNYDFQNPNIFEAVRNDSDLDKLSVNDTAADDCIINKLLEKKETYNNGDMDTEASFLNNQDAEAIIFDNETLLLQCLKNDSMYSDEIIEEAIIQISDDFLDLIFITFPDSESKYFSELQMEFKPKDTFTKTDSNSTIENKHLNNIFITHDEKKSYETLRTTSIYEIVKNIGKKWCCFC